MFIRARFPRAPSAAFHIDPLAFAYAKQEKIKIKQ